MTEKLTHRLAAKIAGCTHRAIGQAVKSGRLPADPDGRITHEALAEWQRARRAPRSHQRTDVRGDLPQISTDMDTDDFPSDAEVSAAADRFVATGMFSTRAEAELARDSYVAHMRRLQYEKAAGLVVEIHHVAKIVGESLARVRTRLLAIPAERAPEVWRAKSLPEVQAAMMTAITEALEELVNADEFAPRNGAEAQGGCLT